LFHVKPPDKKSLQQPAKQENACPGKGLEKSLYPVRRGHFAHICLDTAGITRIAGKLIEIGQVPAGAVGHEAKDLFEKLKGRNALFAFPYRTEISVKQREYPDVMQIGYKKAQTSSAGQTLVGGFDGANFQFLFTVISAILFHQVLHLLGTAILVNALVGFNKYYSILPSDEGLFFVKNRIS